MREQNDLPHCLGSKSYAGFNHDEVYIYIDVIIFVSKCLLKIMFLFFAHEERRESPK